MKKNKSGNLPPTARSRNTRSRPKRLSGLIENLRGFDANLKNLGFTPAIYSPYYQLVSKKLVRKCHAQNMKLIPWTVNDAASMKGLIRLGVDGIITDYPNRIAETGK